MCPAGRHVRPARPGYSRRAASFTTTSARLPPSFGAQREGTAVAGRDLGHHAQAQPLFRARHEPLRHRVAGVPHGEAKPALRRASTWTVTSTRSPGPGRPYFRALVMSSLVITARFVTACVDSRPAAPVTDTRAGQRPEYALHRGRDLAQHLHQVGLFRPLRVDLLVDVHEGADAADGLPQVGGYPGSRSIAAWVSSNPLTIARLLRARWLISSFRCSASSAGARSAASNSSRCSIKAVISRATNNHRGRRQGRDDGREANRLSADFQAVLHLHRAAPAERLGDVVQEEVSLLGREDLVHGSPQQFLGRAIEQVRLGGHDLEVAALRIHHQNHVRHRRKQASGTGPPIPEWPAACAPAP